MHPITAVLGIYFFTFFILLWGILSVYIGIQGVRERRMELYWKKGHVHESLRERYSYEPFKSLDTAKGKYAIFWGILYVAIGIILLAVGLFSLSMMLGLR